MSTHSPLTQISVAIGELRPAGVGVELISQPYLNWVKIGNRNTVIGSQPELF